jgi:tetratricopeptide (TPR) repeat protein
MAAKGLPAKAASKSKAVFVLNLRRLWNFMLEAKGLRQGPAVNYKIKKMLRKQPHAPIPAIRDEEYFLEQIKKFPKDLDLYDDLGQHYIAQKNYEEAKSVYEYLVKHNPAKSDYLARLGFTCLHGQEYEEAVANYNKALALDSSHPNRYYNLALAYTGLGQHRESLDALRQAMKLEPANVKYAQLQADLYHQLGNSAKAREVSRNTARIDGLNQSDKSDL